MTLPTGTVTFLFTDVEGSTQNWDRDSDTMRKALRRHDAILREAIESNGGAVFKTIGDAFCAAFASAEQALVAAAAAQLQLANGDFCRGLRVRMALNSGTADERDGDYFGLAVTRTSRLMSIGHGGQVLVSSATAALLQNALRPQSRLRYLGEHLLKDIVSPERVYQLLAPGLVEEFPALRSLSAAKHNLPNQPSRFVGRRHEVRDIDDLLAAHSLVTIVGSGGVGKTRAALQSAAPQIDKFEDGVWLVELAPLESADLIASRIAQALNLQPENDSLHTLVRAMRNLKALLILDNCEHIIEGAARTATAILRECPRVRILATSRQPLQLSGEMTYRLPALLPDESAALFAQRAVLVDPHFTIDEANRAIVEEICRRLDGIPLAIELAAARVKVLNPNQLSRRLDERFRVLVGSRRDALPRQQTMRAVIDWSYDLLSRPEQMLLQRLGIFSGGWTLDAAEKVCGFEPLASYDILDLQTSLVDKSLVVANVAADEARYRMLESNRSYALEKLTESAEHEAVAERHADWVLRLA